MGDYVEWLISQAGGDGEPAPVRARIFAALTEHAPTAAGTGQGDVACTCFNWEPGEDWLEHIADVLGALDLPGDRL